MQILINLDDQHPIFDEANLDPRARNLMEKYIKERFFNTLMYQNEVQADFAAWLEAHQKKSDASQSTKRWEIRRLRSGAESGINTETLFREMDRLHLNARNNVPNKKINYEISHLIDTTFINRMAKEAQNQNVPLNQRRGLMLFGATLMVGLRTSEWSTAKMAIENPPTLPGETGAYPLLIVQTAKTRKAEPESRALILDEFDQGALRMVEACVDMTQGMSNGSLGQLISGMRRAMLRFAEDADTQDLIQHIDMKTARKIFTVESRRENRSPESVSAALGHTTTNNLRWYAQGDTHCERLTDIPLARAPYETTKKVRDPLEDFNKRKQQAGEAPISGYPDHRDSMDHPDSDEPEHTSLADRLLGGGNS